MILSITEHLKSVYLDLNIVCILHFDIIVSEQIKGTFHFMSPEGKFIMCLLTNSEICYPTALSLKKSTLWIGDELRFVTVFQNKKYQTNCEV